MSLVDINKKLVRNVFLNTELLLNEGEDQIFEYDIQAYMFLFLKRFLKGTGRTAGREMVQKVDCVIFDHNNVPECFYEIKTYFKAREVILQKHFEDDIDKLAKLLQLHSNATAMFITAGLTKKYTDNKAAKLAYIGEHLSNNSSWHNLTTTSGIDIKLRPSVKETRGLCNVMTWEIML
ncbi:hypothetical protein [Vibrio vulnificus]|uniref:hypothetical protein n=1 Tax=Vibrio vulnificus TaxID=672 RepID=UPI000928C510|nr:hypothetical protein [Vibrio vulnificus]OJI53899.1 hypothetical protein VV1062A_02937 [Vibrio vulnificus]OJI53950.1 hypothetical protein VFL11327_04368 [Vibrio fluvialis]POB28459.1 hypothetical protein CRN47_01860 [Vibrio vulnificus]